MPTRRPTEVVYLVLSAILVGTALTVAARLFGPLTGE
jgi:hypothetical protein